MIIEINQKAVIKSRGNLIDGMYEALIDREGRTHNRAAHHRNDRIIKDWQDDGLVDEDEAESLRLRNDVEFDFWQHVTILTR